MAQQARRGNKRDAFIIRDQEGRVGHMPARIRPHLAHEVRESRRLDAVAVADELSRHLFPWARQRALGYA